MLGAISWIMIPPKFWLLMWVRGPQGFGSLLVGIAMFNDVFLLCMLYIVALFSGKFNDPHSKNMLSSIGYPILIWGIIAVIPVSILCNIPMVLLIFHTFSDLI